jgi:hypothetical protein
MVPLTKEMLPGAFGIIAERQPMHGSMLDIACVWNRGGKSKATANAQVICAAPDLITWARWAAFIIQRESPEVCNSWQYEQLIATIAKALGVPPNAAFSGPGATDNQTSETP